MRAEVENAGFPAPATLRLRFNSKTSSTEPYSPAFSQLARSPNAPPLANSQQNANVAVSTPEATHIGHIEPAKSISPDINQPHVAISQSALAALTLKTALREQKELGIPATRKQLSPSLQHAQNARVNRTVVPFTFPQDELAIHSAQDNIDLLLAALYRIRAPPAPHLKRRYIQPVPAVLPQEPLSAHVLKHVSHIRRELADNNPSSHLVEKSCLYGRLILAPKAVGEAREVARHLIPNLSGFP